MPNYTNQLSSLTYNILDAEDFTLELKKAAELFRTFDIALDTFIADHGYTGDMESAEEKVRFISDKCKAAGVPVPRNIKKWYAEHKRIERKTAFQLCFAFSLSVEEVNDFLRRICLEREFDCHSMEEAVYYFSFKHGLRFEQAKDIIGQLEIEKPGVVPKDELVYTELIEEDIDAIETVEELLAYLHENQDKFGYNNATAYETIQCIWQELARENGIAVRERKRLYAEFDKDKEDPIVPLEPEDVEPKDRKRIETSVWEIYLGILGLAGNMVADLYEGRTLKHVLEDNALLHPLAEDSFPDRDGIEKVLHGTHISYERVRKMMILLVFYRFWAKRALKVNSYQAGDRDAERCITEINDNLQIAGYATLYPGNPYDFIILTALNAEYPLLVFREYMREIYAEYEKLKGKDARN